MVISFSYINLSLCNYLIVVNKLQHRFIKLLIHRKGMPKLLIFDLDDTLYDASSTVTKQGIILAVKAMANAGIPVPWQDILKQREVIAKKLGPHFQKVNDELCAHYGIRDKQRVTAIDQAAEAAYNSVDVRGIKLFPGVRAMLARLKKRYPLLLMSTGFEELQQKKVDALGIRDVFEHICIVDGKTMTKSSCLRQALEMYHCAPSQVCVIGDRIDSEIRYGNELGMVTVQLVHGKYSVLTPKDTLEKPTYSIRKITDIEKLAKEIE